MGRRIFDPEGLLWKPLGYLGDVLMLSLLWLLCSIPLVTAGPATAALYDCVVHCLRRKETDLLGRFFRTLRAELRPGILTTLLWAAILFALFFLRGRLMARLGYGGAGGVIGMASLILLLIPVGMASWVFPLLSRFQFSFTALNRTAARLALGHILRTLALGLLSLLGVLACLRFILPIFVLPALLALLWSYLIEPVFRPYMEK